MVAILAPNGDIYKKLFKVKHDVDSFYRLLREIKKVEKEFNMKTATFMESTGVYRLSLFHFLSQNELEVFVINPIITNPNKNKDIRKVKNDKKDALNIAKLGKFEDIKAYGSFHIPVFTLKSLCRDYYKLGEYFKLYLIVDMFSRFIVAYEVWEEEKASYTEHLIRKATLSH